VCVGKSVSFSHVVDLQRDLGKAMFLLGMKEADSAWKLKNMNG